MVDKRREILSLASCLQEQLRQVKNVFLSVAECAFLVQMWNKAKTSTFPCNEYLLHMKSKNIKQKQIQKLFSAYQLLAAKLTLRMNWLGCWYGVGKLFPTATAGHS
jgi:hypothetical protein